MNKKSFWENFIFTVIILAITEIFIEELSYILIFSVELKKLLIISGFIFDVIFSIEFIVRSINSKKEKGFLFYIKYNKGWVDFLSSLPVLLFNSFPLVLGLLSETAIAPSAFFWTAKYIKINKNNENVQNIKNK